MTESFTALRYAIDAASKGCVTLKANDCLGRYLEASTYIEKGVIFMTCQGLLVTPSEDDLSKCVSDVPHFLALLGDSPLEKLRLNSFSYSDTHQIIAPLAAMASHECNPSAEALFMRHFRSTDRVFKVAFVSQKPLVAGDVISVSYADHAPKDELGVLKRWHVPCTC